MATSPRLLWDSMWIDKFGEAVEISDPGSGNWKTTQDNNAGRVLNQNIYFTATLTSSAPGSIWINNAGPEVSGDNITTDMFPRRSSGIVVYNARENSNTGLYGGTYDYDLHIYNTDISEAADVTSVSESSGVYTCDLASHGFSQGQILRINRRESNDADFPTFATHKIDSVNTNDFDIRDVAGLSLSGSSPGWRVWPMEDDSPTPISFTSGIDYPLGVPNAVEYYTEQDGDIFQLEYTTGGGVDLEVGRIKIGTYFEPRLGLTPPYTMTWDDRSSIIRLDDGSLVSNDRTRHRRVALNLTIDDKETAGVSEHSQIIAMLRDTGLSADVFFDKIPGGTTTHDIDNRLLGRIMQKSGPVQTGGYLNGANEYRLSLMLREGV